MVIGNSTVYNFSITVTNTVPTAGGVNITFPKWNSYGVPMINVNNIPTCQVLKPNVVIPVSCTATSGTNYDYVVIKGLDT